MRGWAIVVGLLLGSSCGLGPDPSSTPGPTPGPARRAESSRGKAALYADASLLPTRAGERARRELAIAGELIAALERLGLREVHVDVELGDPAAVVVIADRPTPARVGEAEVHELAAALVPRYAPSQLHLWLRPTSTSASASTSAPTSAPTPGRPWALLLTCLALGVSLGVTGERIRARAQA